MNIYHIHPETRELVKRDKEHKANKDPLESKKQKKDVFMIPANATYIKPPSCAKNEIPIFKNGKWIVAEDHRGQFAHILEAKGELKINVIGPLPDGMVLGKRPPKVYTLDEAKEIKLAELGIEKNKRLNDEISLSDLVYMVASAVISGDHTGLENSFVDQLNPIMAGSAKIEEEINKGKKAGSVLKIDVSENNILWG